MTKYINKYDLDTLMDDLCKFYGGQFPYIAENNSQLSLFFEIGLMYCLGVLVISTIVYSMLGGLWWFYVLYAILWLLAKWWNNKLRREI